MQPVVVAKPYTFVPPYTSTRWIPLLRRWLPSYLRRHWGLHAVRFAHVERLQESLAAGRGVLLAPNHCRLSDPMALGLLGSQVDRPFLCVASWHTFDENPRTAWLMRRFGAFSIHRWGTDRESLKACADILTAGSRPLVLFPEGHCTRHNARLAPLLDGTAFVARLAARQRHKAGDDRGVVIHPVGLRYAFGGDVKATLDPVLTTLETRFGWASQADRPLLERVRAVGRATLALKEQEYFGRPQSGRLAVRLRRLIDRALVPHEQEFFGTAGTEPPAERVKRVRTAVYPRLIAADATPEEKAHRWRQVADAYLAQQVACYPPDYLDDPTPERLIETVERYEEDWTDAARTHRPWTLTATVGEAIAVPAEKEPRGQADPVMATLAGRLRELVAGGLPGVTGQ